MTEYAIIEGTDYDTGQPVFLVLKTDTIASPGATQAFDSMEDAQNRIAHLRKVSAMHRQMYGHDSRT